MSMHRFHALAASALLLVGGFFLPTGTAQAGNVANAQLSCYVDTYAFDYPSAGTCGAAWTPGSASNPTVVVFEVTGLTPGNYAYSWTNLEGGGNNCGNASVCLVPIATETQGDGYAAMAVTVTDLQTGAQNTVYADASYYDGWN